jgi:hypothetical protein
LLLGWLALELKLITELDSNVSPTLMLATNSFELQSNVSNANQCQPAAA